MFTDDELSHGIRTQAPRSPKRKRRNESPTPKPQASVLIPKVISSSVNTYIK